MTEVFWAQKSSDSIG